MSVAYHIGQRFGKVTLLNRIGTKGKWNCQCDCGSFFTVYQSNFLRTKVPMCQECRVICVEARPSLDPKRKAKRQAIAEAVVEHKANMLANPPAYERLPDGSLLVRFYKDEDRYKKSFTCKDRPCSMIGL